MIPVEADLLIVDWSGIVHGAWHEAGPEGLIKRVAGELLDLLASPQGDEGFDVPRLVLAVDAGLPTHRHALTAALDAPKRYKANRTKKPREFWPMVDRLTELVDALRIPTLAPEGFAPQTWEADDAAATTCRLARAAGLSVLLASRDKDWRINVTDEAPAVRWWSALDKKLLDEAGVIEAHGVPPALLADWLALDGDSSDNIPGCAGIGKDKAPKLLKAWPGVAALLAEAPVTAAQLADMTKGVERLRRERDKVKKAFGDASKLAADADAAAASRDLWAWLAVVHAHRADVELSRKLVELRTDVPIVFDADEALVGGWDVREVRAVLDRLGCGWLGNRVERRPKRAPRRTGHGAPAPRRSDVRDQGGAEGERGRPVRDRRDGQLRHEAADALPQGDPGEGRGGAQGPEGDRLTCSYSGCVGSPLHDRARELVAGIVTQADAIAAIFGIRRLNLLELCEVEHVAHASARHRELEGRAA